jgi:hypothetical protein
MKIQQILSSNLGLIVWVLFILVLVYRLPHVADQLPYGMHQWRQCDAYSLALNYFEEDRPINRPAMHFIHGASDGEVVGEFTGTYWLNAQLWKSIGLHPWTMRWTHLLFWLAGIWALYLLCREWLGKKSSAWIVSVVMVSPLMAFYGANYLVNGAALGLVYLGWWFAYCYFQKGELKAWVISFLVITLALLLRPTMGIGLVPLGFAFFQTRFRWGWLGILIFPLLVTGLWVVWSQGMNDRAESIYYCTTIRPLWNAMDPIATWRSFKESMVPEWYHRFVLWSGLIGGVTSGFLMLRKLDFRMDSPRFFLGLSVLGLLVLLIVYVLLWFSNLDVHDYYLIEFQLFVPIFLAWLLYRPEEWLASERIRWGLACFVLPTFLLFQSVDSSLRTRMKYKNPSGWLSEQFLPERERDIWSWFHWDYNHRFGDIQGLGKHLKSMGLHRQDRIISVPDPSPNITLSLMDIRGFTDLYDDDLVGDDRIAHYVARGASVLVCNDKTWFENHVDSPWLTFPLDGFESFLLFDLRRSQAYVDSVNNKLP